METIFVEPSLQVGEEYIPLSRLNYQQTNDLLEKLLNKWSLACQLPDKGPANQLQNWIDMCDQHLLELEYQEAYNPQPKEEEDNRHSKVAKRKRRPFGKMEE